MFVYDEDKVRRCYERNLAKAKEALKPISSVPETQPNFTGLSGWVFEQTIHACIFDELDALHIKADVRQHVALKGRVKADLAVGTVAAVELKAKGLFSKGDAAKYSARGRQAEAVGFCYLYLTLGETYSPYRDGVTSSLGADNVFFLDTEGDWERFVNRILDLLANVDSQSRGVSKQ
jgi:hypothetical protein